MYYGIDEIKSLDIQAYIINRWERVLGYAYNYEYTRQAMNRYELQKLDLASYGLLGIFMILTWKFNVDRSIIAIILMYILTMVSEFENVLRNIRHSEMGIESLKRLENIGEYTDIPLDTENNSDLLNSDYELIFENVSGGYLNGQYVFDKICVNIKKGERVLIQGESGIGKTTLFNCLENLVSYEGNLYFQGINIKNIDRKELRDRICVIIQENLILDDSLSENLDPYGEYTLEEKINALKVVGWYDYNLQMNCCNLSKMERLSVALARVCLKKSRCLIIR